MTTIIVIANAAKQSIPPRHCERSEAIHQFDFGSNFAEKKDIAAPARMQSTEVIQLTGALKPDQPGKITNTEPQINPKITA